MNANRTSFKKGGISVNCLPLGAERLNSEGYREIKVGNPSKWKPYGRYLYEKHHGEIPPNHYVIFADKDKTNFDINNLILVSRSQMLILNQNKLIYEDAELTKVGVSIAKVLDTVNKVKK